MKKILLLFLMMFIADSVSSTCKKTSTANDLTGKCQKNFMGDYNCITATANKDCKEDCSCNPPIIL